MNKREVQLSEEAIEALEHYAWPGNIRELINVIERAVLLNVSGTIEPREFPFSKEEREISSLSRRKGNVSSSIFHRKELPLEAVEKAYIRRTDPSRGQYLEGGRASSGRTRHVEIQDEKVRNRRRLFEEKPPEWII